MKKWRYDSARDLIKRWLAASSISGEPDMLVYGLRSCGVDHSQLAARLPSLWKLSDSKLRDSGSFVMVANHSSHLMPFTSLPPCRLPTTSGISDRRRGYFFKRAAHLGYRRWLTPYLSRVKSVRQAFAFCELLSNPGNILIIFPEGTRSTTPTTQDFKSGSGRFYKDAM
jgi:1-acyl-sn-glycerol-3-phosphate acyltransferase